MLNILEVFREKYTRNLLLVMGSIGFLFVFFYQVLVTYDFSKVNFKLNLTEQSYGAKFYLLSGWVNQERTNEKDVIWSKGESSTIALFFPKRNSYQIKISLLFSGQGLIKIYVNKNLLTMLKPKEITKWQDFQFVVPYNFISEGFNKIGFIKISKNKIKVGYKDLRVINYQRIPWAFPGGYILFNKVRWISRGNGINVNWLYCLLGGILLPIVWIIYSILFSSLGEVKFIRALRLDFFTYLPITVLLFVIYLFSRLFFYNPIINQKYFLLFGIATISSGKMYQLYRYARKSKIKLYMHFIRDILATQITGLLFIIGFLSLLMISTFFLIFKAVKIAEPIAGWAYLTLVMATMSKLVAISREKIILQKGFLSADIDFIVYNKMNKFYNYLQEKLLITFLCYLKILVSWSGRASLLFFVIFIFLFLAAFELSIIYVNKVMAAKVMYLANLLLAVGIITGLVYFFLGRRHLLKK